MSADRAERPPRTPAEWWTFGVSVTLVALIAGLILLSWTTGATGPPVLTAAPSGPAERQGTTYRVPFEVHNSGGEAATDVQVLAELVIDGEVVGERDQSIMFLSGGESEHGAFLFDEDPATGALTLEVGGYLAP